MQLDLTGYRWFSDSAWKQKLSRKIMWSHPSHVPDLWVFWSQLRGVSVFSATGTAAKGQTRSSLATAQSVHLHLLPEQSLLTHIGTICMLLQPKPNAGEMSSDFCTPFWFALSLFSELLFVLYFCCVMEYLTAIWVLLLGALASFKETV